MAKQRAERQRQTQLAFAPLPSSSPARASQPEAVRDRVAAVTINMSPRPSRNKSTARGFLPTPIRSSQNTSESFLNLAPASSPSSRLSRKSFISSANVASSKASLGFSDQSDSDESLPTPVAGQKRPITLHDSDSDDVVVISSQKRRRIHGESFDVEGVPPGPVKKRPMSMSIDSDSDIVVARTPRRALVSAKVNTDAESDTAITPSTKRSRILPQSDSEVEKAAPTARITRSAKAKPQIEKHNRSSFSTQINEEDETDEGEIESSPERTARKSSATKRTTPARKRMTRQDRDDLQEDLEFLEGTDTPPTMKATNKHTAKQQALDALRRKRSKQKSMEGSITRQRVIISSDEAENSDSHNTEHESDDNFVDELTAMAPEDLDEDDDDFVIQDDNSVLGAPVELPVEFSRYQSMKPAGLFKFVVEWMVQKKINPAFEMDDEIYRFSFARLDDFVKGLGGSKYQSSAWTSKFSKSLKSRPILEDHRFLNSGLMHDRCDACNRSGHPATWEVRFTGNCYDKNSLEEDSDEESDEESPSVPGPSTTYYIGKFCMRNARTAHALAHWRFHLNEWVVDFLKDEGYCSPEKIVERDGWSIKRRRKYANKIVDKMQAAGEIKRLHRDFRNEINTAQYANEPRWDNSSP